MKKLTKPNFKIIQGSSGTNFSLNISLEYLIKKLGKPTQIGSGDNKIQLEWDFIDNQKVLTIYDYKENKPIHKINYWHIGSKNILNKEIQIELEKMGFIPKFEIKFN